MKVSTKKRLKLLLVSFIAGSAIGFVFTIAHLSGHVGLLSALGWVVTTILLLAALRGLLFVLHAAIGAFGLYQIVRDSLERELDNAKSQKGLIDD